ncbi:MAG TPA: protein kinase [Vicinamibacteria bacterium]|nr:protein kinase [Vicinamibacteria bacterium]
MDQEDRQEGRAPRLTPNPSRQGLLKRLLGGLRAPASRTDATGRSASASPGGPARFGRYRVLERIGQGGMGVVFAAEDDSLGRRVAVKTIAEPDEAARKRFRREARAAAAVNHPNVCQVYEIGEDSGQLYIVMELLCGEPLSERLARGPMPVAETVALGRGMLSALGALHAGGIVHRDLKPSNVFLTPHGVKLLDFGLARPLPAELTASMEATADLTRSGVLVGTPRYMAPEQVQGQEVDARTDLFSAAAILYEAAAGRPPFLGQNLVQVLSATLHEQPPALSGDAAVVALDRVLRRALAKRPADRHASAADMLSALESVASSPAGATAAVARPLTRLVVLPFRLLRPDPEVDFLAFALADAVSASLAALPSLLLRSSAAAARFAAESPDLKAIAAQADVDLVLMGTLLRAGEQIRVSTQLVEAPAGTLVSSQSLQAPVGDVFRLQDELAQRIVESLSGPLAGGKPRRGVPASARAYEFYLRGNELGRQWAQVAVARDLYQQCVDEDPNFAPAWARLGRCHRLQAKFFNEQPAENLQRAEQAFQRALELDPELPVAHKLYAHHEAERGFARRAMERLLGLARRNRNDPEVFAGLVHACRYCGLLEASDAAHRETLRLDPHLWTSVVFTWWAQGQVDRIQEATTDADDFEIRALSLHAVGRTSEALQVMRRAAARALPPVLADVRRDLTALMEGDPGALHALRSTVALHTDPEALYMYACCLVTGGDRQAAQRALARAVEAGYAVPQALRQTWLAPLRGPALDELVARAESGRAEAERSFREAGGDALLGL